MLMITNDGAGGIDATAAAAPDRQLHLNLAQGARALINSAADLAIRDSVADADVHGEPSNLHR